MNKGTLLTSLSLLALLSACGGLGNSADIPEAQPAGATSADIGNHIIYFSAQSTDQLLPAVAREYDIVRSKNRAMLNVSIIRESDNLPVMAEVIVKAVNLAGQLKNITMRKIEEPDDVIAIYYIGDTTVANREVLVFDIGIKPEGEDAPSTVRFERQFYSD
ncbi:MAG: DUF4426 domain-containing protein [Gammaproteobacteria bacterium]|jgi:hypothetical protein|nr:DUF4426 domain-containing protein [Gammaproteobacteria bacterium]